MTTHDLDLLTPDAFRDGIPHDIFQQLRAQNPVFPMRLPDGRQAWSLVRYDDVTAALRDLPTFKTPPVEVPARLCPAHGPAPEDPWAVKGVMVLRPPDHSAARRRLTWLQHNDLIEASRSAVRAIAERAVIAACGHQTLDAIGDFAAPAAAAVVGQYLGVDPGAWPYLRRLSAMFMGDTLPDPADGPLSDTVLGPLALRSIGGSPGRAAMDLVADAWGQQPWLDSDFVRTATRWEMEDLGGQLLAAGVAGLRNAIAFAVRCVADSSHDIRERREEWLSKLDLVADEVLRHASPLLRTRRVLDRTLELGGRTIAAGEVVVMWLASANFDETVFPEPTRFVPFRSPNRHLSFSVGAHRCLGAGLARMQLEEFLRALVLRCESVELLHPPICFPSNTVSEISSMPVRMS